MPCCLYLTFCYLISPFISDGEIHLDTPYSRLLGKPPIMVAGMTPSTVKAGFVSAVLDAGYHIELAGGGHYKCYCPSLQGGRDTEADPCRRWYHA